MAEDVRVIEGWISSLPEPCTAERVRERFWYVRIAGEKRRWVPIELELRERTLKATSHVIITPDENHAEVYAFLLRHNHAAREAAFSLDAREGVICLVGRLRREELSHDRLDSLVGHIVETTETTFRSILQLGFASRLGRS